MTLFKNAKWLIFGGIGYRLRGFLIGVAVGFGLSTLMPSAVDHIKGYLSWIVPQAHAALIEDFNHIDDLSVGAMDYFQVPQFANSDYGGQQFPVFTDGRLEFIELRLSNYDPCAGCTYSVEIWSDNGSNAPGVLLGQSVDYDYSTLPLRSFDPVPDIDDYPGIVIPLYPETSTSLDVLNGGLYWFFIEFVDGDGPSDQRIVTYTESGTGTGLRRRTCLTLPAGSCTNTSNLGNLKVSTYVETDPQPFTGIFNVSYGPHVSLDPDEYTLTYYCGHAGSIYVQDLAVSPAFVFSGEICGAGDSGPITVDLSGDITNLTFELRFGGVTVADSAATIFYNPNSGPVLPPDGSEEVDIGFCLPFLTSDEEVIEPELNVDEEISEGFLAWAKGVALGAFTAIYGGLSSVPVIGDYMVINCIMYDHFISNLDPSAPGFSYTVDFDTGFMGMDETDTFTLDMATAYDSLNAQVDASIDSDNYDTFRELMSVLLIFIVVWKVFSFVSFGSHHSDDDHS